MLFLGFVVHCLDFTAGAKAGMQMLTLAARLKPDLRPGLRIVLDHGPHARFKITEALARG